MLKFDDLLINCNRLAKIFARNSNCITEKEIERINVLIAKERIGKITEKESDRLEALIEKRDDSEPHIISVAAQLYLLYIYTIRKYGMRPKLFTNGYVRPEISNGILKEPQAIRLISEVSGVQLYRNKKTYKNFHLRGIFDAFDAPEMENSEKIYEIKTTSDIYSFLQRKRYPLTRHNLLQMHGYLALSNKDCGEINFCLVDYAESVILEQREAMFRYLCPDGKETASFRTEWAKMENQLRFLDIPAKDRIFTCVIDRDEQLIDRIYKKVEDCRKWLNDFAEFNEEVIETRYVDANKIRL